MTLTQFLEVKTLSDDQKLSIVYSTIKTIVDTNWPGMKTIPSDLIKELTKYVDENYEFRFVNGALMNSVIAEPKK